MTRQELKIMDNTAFAEAQALRQAATASNLTFATDPLIDSPSYWPKQFTFDDRRSIDSPNSQPEQFIIDNEQLIDDVGYRPNVFDWTPPVEQPAQEPDYAAPDNNTHPWFMPNLEDLAEQAKQAIEKQNQLPTLPTFELPPVSIRPYIIKAEEPATPATTEKRKWLPWLFAGVAIIIAFMLINKK